MQWRGRDSEGSPWPPSWVTTEDCSAALLRDWLLETEKVRDSEVSEILKKTTGTDGVSVLSWFRTKLADHNLQAVQYYVRWEGKDPYTEKPWKLQWLDDAPELARIWDSQTRMKDLTAKLAEAEAQITHLRERQTSANHGLWKTVQTAIACPTGLFPSFPGRHCVLKALQNGSARRTVPRSGPAVNLQPAIPCPRARGGLEF